MTTVHVPSTRRGLQPYVVAALVHHGHSCHVQVVESDYDYCAFLVRWLLRPGRVAVVEHDVEIIDDVVGDMLRCGQPWCCTPYPHNAVYGSGPGSDDLLGCTVLDASYPAVIYLAGYLDAHPVPWTRLDMTVAKILRGEGLRPHGHRGLIVHHHGWHVAE